VDHMSPCALGGHMRAVPACYSIEGRVANIAPHALPGRRGAYHMRAAQHQSPEVQSLFADTVVQTLLALCVRGVVVSASSILYAQEGVMAYGLARLRLSEL